MTVLVAGAAGLLGSAIANRLLDRGEAVVAADSFEDTGDGRAVKESRAALIERSPHASLVRIDLSDRSAAEGLFADARPSTVVNAARFAPDGEGAGPLMALARESGTGFFLHLSDGALYAPGRDAAPAQEDEALDPGSDPGLRLRAAEEEALRAAALPHAILRVFELVGPLLPVGRFPMEAVEALLSGEEVFLPDDEPRDYLHIHDASRAALLALDRRPLEQVVNLGSGAAVRPGRFLEEVARAAGLPLRLSITGPPPERPPRVADPARARTLLGFLPHYTLERTVDEIVRARRGVAPAGRAGMEASWGLPAPEPIPEAPRPVSRRELFDLFRRPFGRGPR